LSSADKEEGGSSDAPSALFGAKNIGFFKIYGVSVRTRKEEGLCGSEKRLIFFGSESATKKVQLPLPSFLKN